MSVSDNTQYNLSTKQFNMTVICQLYSGATAPCVRRNEIAGKKEHVSRKFTLLSISGVFYPRRIEHRLVVNQKLHCLSFVMCGYRNKKRKRVKWADIWLEVRPVQETEAPLVLAFMESWRELLHGAQVIVIPW